MESVQWFLLGVASTLCVFGFSYLSLRISAPWYAWVVLIGGALYLWLNHTRPGVAVRAVAVSTEASGLASGDRR